MATIMVRALMGVVWVVIQVTQVAMMIRMARSGYHNQLLRAKLMTARYDSKMTNSPDGSKRRGHSLGQDARVTLR